MNEPGKICVECSLDLDHSNKFSLCKTCYFTSSIVKRYREAEKIRTSFIADDNTSKDTPRDSWGDCSLIVKQPTVRDMCKLMTEVTTTKDKVTVTVDVDLSKLPVEPLTIASSAYELQDDSGKNYVYTDLGWIEVTPGEGVVIEPPVENSKSGDDLQSMIARIRMLDEGRKIDPGVSKTPVINEDYGK